MKLTLLSLLCALSAGIVVSPVESSRPQPVKAKRPPLAATPVACLDDTPTAPQPERADICVRGTDMTPVPQPDRFVALSEPPRPWLLPDKMWQSINNSLVNVDLSIDRQDEYIGVRFVLPFGS
jgi:hypothetical protein